jgi:hypothetical protein
MFKTSLLRPRVKGLRCAITLVSLVWLLSGLAQSQNSRVDGVVSTRYNNPASAAFVTACTQPATILTSAPYCSPLAPLCASLTDPSCNGGTFPVQSDGLGNYHYYVSKTAGPYTICFYGPSLAVPVLNSGCLPDQYPPGAAGAGTVSILGSAQTGDCLRFNSAGDSTWDVTNCSMEVNGIYESAQGGPVGFGPICTGNIGLATGTGSSLVFPTATRRAGITYFITPGPSTSTVVGMDCGQNGSNSIFPILAWYRYSTLFAISSTTNTRYWVGLATWNNGSALGTNSTNILNTNKFATDSPNSNTIAFRYSSGTDTTFKAVSCVAAGSCTVTDTAVTADTSPHLFELTTNPAGTSIQYFIDHLLVATITTNIPPALGTSDGLVDIFWTGDNKNNNLSPSATFYMAQFSLK